MRVIDSTALSIWSWLAAISSSLTPPVFAASTIRLLTEFSRSLISLRYPSVVAITELARSELLMAWSSPLSSERKRSEMIRPAGSSAPRLIRSPVESRWSRMVRSFVDRARLFRAIIEGMFVLILAMAILLDC